jgi:sensor histidine kinase regulating citrate/malate metabolism
MYVRLLVYSESLQQTQVLQGQLTAYARRISMIEDFQHQIMEMRHDLKNILFTLNIDMEQQNYEQVNQRIADLLGHLKQVEPEHYTGVSLIDAVISYKAVRLRELGARFEVQADLLDIEVPIASPGAAKSSALAYDIASIMGTALDNVTDACETIVSHETVEAPPDVYCKIQSQKNMLLIQIINPLPGPLHYKNGEIQSAKTESGHGLGLPALRRIVQKYAGEVTITDSGNVFCLSVMLFI